MPGDRSMWKRLVCAIFGHAPEQVSMFWRDGFRCFLCHHPLDPWEVAFAQRVRVAILLGCVGVAVVVLICVYGGNHAH